VLKSGCWTEATALYETDTLSFVIPSEAVRDLQFYGPFVEMFFNRA
jgi:hypothetical protein